MRLRDLIEGLPDLVPTGTLDINVTAIATDSRLVQPDTLFAALPGVAHNGIDFVPQALAAGANALLIPDSAPLSYRPHIPVLRATDPRITLSLMAARLYAPQPETIVAITGTNGKTSTAVFARQIWQALGYNAASLGTLGLNGPNFHEYSGLTTPDPVVLHRSLAKAARSGCTHLAMEASSHGLDQRRLDGVQIKAAAFTNLTRDHLDYHKTETDYFAAKSRLFTEILPREGIALINADDPRAVSLQTLAHAAGRLVWSYGYQGRELRLLSRSPSLTGQDLTLEVFGETVRITLPLVGTFQAINALAALGLVIAGGENPYHALQHLPALTGVPGRMQMAGKHLSGAPVYVDYAHTPDSLENALQALRPHVKGRLIVVFGCGGDRDRGKRPIMGRIASHLADIAIITDDNPRSENPATIRDAVLAGCPAGLEIGNRRDAILKAVSLLCEDDILLIAGKGHENGQIVGDTIFPFDDIEEVRAALGQTGTQETHG